MKKELKFIILGIVIVLISFPTLTLGGMLISSLIEGKDLSTAVAILANQIDLIWEKVFSFEARIGSVERNVSNDEACWEANRLYTLLPPVQKDESGQWIGRIVMVNNIVDLYNLTKSGGDPRDLLIVKEYYDRYVEVQNNCGK